MLEPLFPHHYHVRPGWELRSSVPGHCLWSVRVVLQVLSNLRIRCPWSGVENTLVGYVLWLYRTYGLLNNIYILGHSQELLADCGKTEAEFRQRYGDVVRVKAALGVRCFL